jgi:hypothetical protein
MLTGIIGCYSSFPEPLQQSRANTIFRDTNPELLMASARAIVWARLSFPLDELVIAVRPRQVPYTGIPSRIA